MTDADLPLTTIHREPEVATDEWVGAMFVMHGRGADEEDLLPIAAQLPDNYHVFSFRAPTPLGPGYTWYALDTSEGLHSSQPNPEDFQRSRTQLRTAIETALSTHDLTDTTVGLLGFSQGAVMALSLLVDDPSWYSWVGALHGYLPDAAIEETPEGLDGQPVFLGAGETDQIIPPDRAKAAADRLREIGCHVTFSTFPTGHGIGQSELQALISFVEEQTP